MRTCTGNDPPGLKSGGFPVRRSSRPPVLWFRYLNQSRDVLGGVSIGRSDMPARLADELRLTLAVGTLAVAAPGARPARVAWINLDHGHASQLGLVCQECVELREGPSRESIASVTATGRNPASD